MRVHFAYACAAAGTVFWQEQKGQEGVERAAFATVMSARTFNMNLVL